MQPERPLPIPLADCDTVSSVNHALLFGLPVLIVVVLIALIYRKAGNRPAPYRLPQPWTHEPVLWTATEEPIPVRQHGGDHVVGGGASGRW